MIARRLTVETTSLRIGSGGVLLPYQPSSASLVRYAAGSPQG
ncbi:hypothetical protein [Micromonospora humida]